MKTTHCLLNKQIVGRNYFLPGSHVSVLLSSVGKRKSTRWLFVHEIFATSKVEEAKEDKQKVEKKGAIDLSQEAAGTHGIRLFVIES